MNELIEGILLIGGGIIFFVGLIWVEWWAFSVTLTWILSLFGIIIPFGVLLAMFVLLVLRFTPGTLLKIFIKTRKKEKDKV